MYSIQIYLKCQLIKMPSQDISHIKKKKKQKLHTEKAIGDRGGEKLPFNKQKPWAEPD